MLALLTIALLAAPPLGSPEALARNAAIFDAVFDCIVKREPERATAHVLAEPVVSTGFSPPLMTAARGCLYNSGKADSFRMGGYLGRGDLARALLRAGEKPAGAPIVGVQPAKPVDLATDRFGACLAAAGPAEARAFVAALPASGAEHAALAALQPLVEPCEQPGTDLQINADRLRAALAVALFRAG